MTFNPFFLNDSIPGSSVLLELISVRGKLLGEVQLFALERKVIEFKEKGNISCLENELQYCISFKRTTELPCKTEVASSKDGNYVF